MKENNKEKQFFKVMLLFIGAMFAVTCFSIIFCVIKSNTVDNAQSTSHIMSIVYMAFHLVMEGIVFYYTFKAMVSGASLIKMAMFAKDNIPNKKSQRNAIIFMSVSLLIAVWMLVTIIVPAELFLSFFALGLKFALLNFFALVATIAAFFFVYSKVGVNQ